MTVLNRRVDIGNHSDLACPNMYGYNSTHRVSLCGRASIAIVLLFALAACGRASSPSDPSEIQPGQRDYPVTNPHPTHVLTIDATIPPTLSVSITAIYLASPTAGGTMESGTACQRTVGLAVTAPFSLTEPVRLLQGNGTYTASVPVDGLLPGRCDWSFGGLNYSVRSMSDSTDLPEGVLVRLGDQGSATETLDVWCIRDLEHGGPDHPQFWGEFCSSLDELRRDFPGKILRAPVTPAAGSAAQGPPIVIGRDTDLVQIRFHDADVLRDH